MMRHVLACLLTLVCLCSGCGKAGLNPQPKAVFLIVVDTLRPDRLSCYGYESHDTPNIDRLAESGVLFERMHAGASWTGPSMGTIMTSRHSTQLGMIERPVEQTTFRARERRKQINNAPPLEATTLAEIMQAAGFRTAGFINQAFLNVHAGYLQGLEEWCHTVDTDRVAWHDPSQPVPTLSLSRDAELGHADGPLIDAFVEWLDTTDERRPFVWLHLLRPHWPYMPPPEYLASHPGTKDPSKLYDGEIRATDDDIGRVLDAIDGRYGLEHCVVVFTSDHGEAFGEHGGYEHGHTLHAEVSHVPMIILAPGLPGGARVASVVRTADILPTVLELASVAPHAGDTFVGESLLGLIDRGGEDRTVYGAGILYEGTELSWIRDGYRVMYELAGEDRWSLYDLKADPREEFDITTDRPSLLETMREELNVMHEQYIAELLEAIPELVADDAEDERALRSLRALGYIK